MGGCSYNAGGIESVEFCHKAGFRLHEDSRWGECTHTSCENCEQSSGHYGWTVGPGSGRSMQDQPRDILCGPTCGTVRMTCRQSWCSEFWCDIRLGLSCIAPCQSVLFGDRRERGKEKERKNLRCVCNSYERVGVYLCVFCFFLGHCF